MAKFKGIITATITPFSKLDGSIFELGITNQIKYLKQHGIENVFVNGSYGAFPLMDTDERNRVAQIAVETCKMFEMKCIVHVGSPCTKTSLRLARYAQAIGADAISSVVPFYYSGTFYTEDEYINYFHDLINAVNIDVHAYNNPGTTGFNIGPEFLDKLVDIGLKGIKDGGSDMGRMLEMIDVVSGRTFDYYPSSTSSLITGFLLGAESCISGVSLSCPDLIMGIYNNMMGGYIHKATEIWKKVMEIRSVLGMYGGRAVAAYEVLNWRGVSVGEPRLPWIKLNERQRNTLITLLIGAGIDERI